MDPVNYRLRGAIMDMPQMNLTVFARDSLLWSVLFYASMALVLATGLIDNPADYGLSPVAFRWLKLASAVIAGLSGKSGWSWTPTRATLEGR
jgi:hypothetical protein